MGPPADVFIAWIASWEDRYGPPPPEIQQIVPSRPSETVRPEHNSTPAPPQRRVSRDGYVNWTSEAPVNNVSKNLIAKKRQKRRVQRGQKWDHLRTREPIIIPNYLMRDQDSPWRNFVQASKYGHAAGENAETVDPEKLNELMPGFNDNTPLRFTDDAVRSRSRRAAFHEHAWRILLNHPLVPAILRFSVLLLSIISLALSANLWKLYADAGDRSSNTAGISLRSQWLVAIVVDCVVTPYVFYMTWDEWTGPQFGLRSPMHKVSLTLLDLFFIIFKSASATLAFDSLYLRNNPYGEMAKMKALASFLLLGLIGWIMNFTVNVFRLVQRLGTGAGDEDRRLVSHA
ncbi:hypothetical protein M406DRAFT_288406 [Cryphonectria parasitica EP155]|uniref:Regulator of phospholipase D SRF1 n=1 Tax=Cryphonectria parasitica (strain ATCC 38755 / EP155) TaxID=660469 RepID=A0A9P4Y623_CRYP1|nr:uncharacterized protein M406DRAFT_288406 [Cryphonectria parasitica EP155]KAF3767383.1 hypothetical protein M406DRAFT_288406 [Cryphonectria parasitica EP155]